MPKVLSVLLPGGVTQYIYIRAVEMNASMHAAFILNALQLGTQVDANTLELRLRTALQPILPKEPIGLSSTATSSRLRKGSAPSQLLVRS